MMKALALLLLCVSIANALALATSSLTLRTASMSVAAPRTTPALMQFGREKKSPEEILEEKGYWPGEWICADCGYIYEPGTQPAFEELRSRWKCPQCAGPRRRFVKKAGGMTGQIDDSPLFIGMGLTFALILVLLYAGLTV